MEIHINNKIYWDNLIIDYLSGHITREDISRLESWKKESKEHLIYFNEMKTLWDSSGMIDKNLPFDEEKAYLLFYGKCRSTKKKQANHFHSKWLSWKKAISFAAVLFPFILLSYFTVLYFMSEVKRDIPSLTEISSPKGSRTLVKLNDGSQIWLNSGSTITYTPDFGKTNRELKLSGEAYLEVCKNEQLPFIVNAGNMEIKVLGTKFNVNAYNNNENIQVFLLKGSVSLTNEKNIPPVILHPMEMAVCSNRTNQISVLRKQKANALEWMQNRLVFENETLEEVVRILEHYYDVDIYIKDPHLKNRRFAGDFKLNKPLEKILEVMAASKKFKYKIKQNSVEIY